MQLANGTLLPAQPFGHVYRFECNSPAVLIGPALLRCLCTGKWSGRAPICQGDVEKKL